MSESKQFCTFRLGDLFLGVEVSRVQEVLRYQDMTNVPLTSPVIAGLINLRGQIVTAIDLRRRFGLPPQDGANALPMNVVVRTDDDVVSLLVDEIGDVLEIDDDTFAPPPATLAGVARDLIRGVHKLEGQLLLVLDVQATLNIDAASVADYSSIGATEPTATAS